MISALKGSLWTISYVRIWFVTLLCISVVHWALPPPILLELGSFKFQGFFNHVRSIPREKQYGWWCHRTQFNSDKISIHNWLTKWIVFTAHSRIFQLYQAESTHIHVFFLCFTRARLGLWSVFPKGHCYEIPSGSSRAVRVSWVLHESYELNNVGHIQYMKWMKILRREKYSFTRVSKHFLL